MSEKGEFIDQLGQLAERTKREREIARSLSSETALLTAVEHLTDVLLMSTTYTETHRAMERAANPEKFGL